MKNIKLNQILLAFIFLMVAGACNEEVLDVKPVNQYLSENYFVSDQQVYDGLIAAYDPVGWSMAFGQWVSPVMFGEIRSDNANAGGDASDNDQPGWQELDDLRESDANTILQPIFRKYYIGIFRANVVLLSPQITSPAIERYQAEAKFLRAYYHFELFKHFGPIPVVKELLTPEDVDLTRSTMTEVFEAITQDLEEAIAVLPVTLSSAEVGRASRGSAQALLGKAYLYWADMDNDDPAKFDLAAQALRAVVESNQYALEDDFNSLFAFGTKNTAESVFEIQHSNLWPSDWGWFEGIEGNGITQLCGIRGICEGHPFYQAGWGFMLPTQDLYDHFLTDDTYRREAAIISVPELTQTIQDEGISGCNVVVNDTEGNPIDNTGYWQQKYANFKAYNGNNVNGGDPNLTKDPNTYAIRYADVLLMLAEAVFRGSSSNLAEAQSYVDIVRERAAGPGDNSGTFRTAAQVMAAEGWDMLEMIWYERRAELAGEGDRWYDLVRSGRVTADLFAGDAIRSPNFNPEEDRFIPISLEETTVSQQLTTYPEASHFQ